jgi:hypothetical protein
MSQLSSKFYKAAYMSDTVNGWCSLTSTLSASLRISSPYQTSKLFALRQSLPNFHNHQIMINITASPSGKNICHVHLHVISYLSRYDQRDLLSSHQVKSKSIYKCVYMETCLLTIRSVNIAKFTSLPPLSLPLSSKQSFSNVSPNCWMSYVFSQRN